LAQTLVQFEEATLNRWMGLRFRFDTRLNLYIERIVQRTTLTVRQRVRMCGQFLLDRTRINLSRPVRKIKTKAGRIAVDRASRSKRGEFPRADTTTLMKGIFLNMSEDGMIARVGTPHAYGLRLEVQMDRSFLRRSLNELREYFLIIIQGGRPPG
jgi:hypothetical protein